MIWSLILQYSKKSQLHYVKRVPFGIILVVIFPGFSRIQTEYGVSLRIQSECGKIREKCGPE